MSERIHSKPRNTILRIVIFLLLLLLFWRLYCYVNSTKEIIETSEESTIETAKDTIATITPQKDTIAIKEVLVPIKKIEKTKKVATSVKPKKKKKKRKIVPKSIYVASFITDKSRKVNRSEGAEDVSLFVFNSNDKIDKQLSNRFIQEFDSKGYAAYPSFIVSNQLTPEVIYNLTSRNIDYFKGNLEKYVDYICVAKVAYSYGENVLRDDMLNCNMKVDYLIYSSETGELMLSESDLVIGTGFKKDEARKDAIEKFIL